MRFTTPKIQDKPEKFSSQHKNLQRPARRWTRPMSIDFVAVVGKRQEACMHLRNFEEKYTPKNFTWTFARALIINNSQFTINYLHLRFRDATYKIRSRNKNSLRDLRNRSYLFSIELVTKFPAQAFLAICVLINQILFPRNYKIIYKYLQHFFAIEICSFLM